MTLKFRNPANGDVIEISYLSCVAAFFLGPLFLLAYGFTWHALIWTVLAFGPTLVWNASVLDISLPATCLLYSLAIHPLLIAKLRAHGWTPTTADALPGNRQRGYLPHNDTPGTGRAPTGLALAPVLPTLATHTPDTARLSPSASLIDNEMLSRSRPRHDQSSASA